jgi:hypothetical protein
MKTQILYQSTSSVNIWGNRLPGKPLKHTLHQPNRINPAINYVIPAAAKRRAGIQQMPQFYGIPALAGLTGGYRKDTSI